MASVSNVRCSNCGRYFGLDLTAVSEWLEAHAEERPKHYPAQCTHCQRVVKVPVRQVRHLMPRKADAKA